MNAQFSIRQWSAFASGLRDQDAWRQWSQAPFLPRGEDVPTLSEMPAMQRRRLERIGRIALQVAYDCQPSDSNAPFVFVSRHGDIQKTHDMLESLAIEGTVSPTQFSLSVHNAIAAQYSIARGFKQNYSAIGAGKSSAEAGLIEAVGLLADGADEVVLVYYDGLIPAAYAGFNDEPLCEYAWAWRIGSANTEDPSYSLQVSASESDTEIAEQLPHGLRLMQFILSEQAHYALHCEQRQWLWNRHA